MATKQTATLSAQQPTRPPIVAVLGHVDHGKTSLLDTIRKTHVTQREAGGITQHIGAYQIEVKGQKAKGKSTEEGKITFIDTPGHEAFAKMRSRGSQAADIAILVVAATEGVKPQTIESIAHIKKAGIPYIVAMNKSDLPEANVDKIKQQLAKAEVLVENFGGDIVALPVSAKTGAGIPELLDTILLIAGMQELTADPQAVLHGVIIESRLDKGKGPVATVIVRNGTIVIGQTIFAEGVEAKVRAMHDSLGKAVVSALPSMPVEVMGWKSLPLVGASVYSGVKIAATPVVSKFLPREFALPAVSSTKKLRMILKADVAGSLEAIAESFGDDVEIVHAATGEINESDIMMAKSTGSVVIGFNLKPNNALIEFARTEKVRLKVYSIVYELLDEIREVLEILNKPEAAEEVLGEAVILAEFDSGDTKIAGCKVESGRIARGDSIRLMRRTEEITQTKIKSMKHGKDDISKAEAPSECGIIFDKKLDFKLSDRIIAYKVRELL